MSYIKIYIHAVWTTKDRFFYLTKNIRKKLIDHINGHDEHLHCLVSMSVDQNIATIMNLLMGESSFWMNKQKLTKERFGWQNEYFAVSIGESQIDSVRKYIRNQETHHQKKNFQQEYDEFIKNYKFE